MKVCGKCDAEKALDQFGRDKRQKDGLNRCCKICVNAYSSMYQSFHNSPSKKKKSKRYRYMNSGKARELARRRLARIRLATPAWADKAKIKSIYAKAAQITEKTGKPHSVDHIYAIAGKTVCGLHVHNNLQILTRLENLKKGRKYPSYSMNFAMVER